MVLKQVDTRLSLRTSNLFKVNVKNKVDNLVRAVEYIWAKSRITEQVEEYKGPKRVTKLVFDINFE